MSSLVDVRLIRVFEGLRHDRLRLIWDVIAEYCSNSIRLKWFENSRGQLRHAECLNHMWRESLDGPANRVVFTEADFLPNLHSSDWLLQEDLAEPDVAFSGVCYAKRAPGSRKVVNFKDVAGAWFLSFDLTRCPTDFDFDGPMDPATTLISQLKTSSTALLYPGTDCYPEHHGLAYCFGIHAFWSRHLHDPPETRVSGYRVGELQKKHDNLVHSWIASQPLDFIELLMKRSPYGTWESSYASIDVTSTFQRLSGSYTTLDVDVS